MISKRNTQLWRDLLVPHLLGLVLLLGIAPTATAQDAARITSPLAGSTDVDASGSVTWQAVAGATAYYLYVGTAVGLKDLVDTGEIQATAWPMISLPAGRVLYARLYTKRATGWTWSDSSFSLRSVATFLQPASEAQELDVRADRISWTRVGGAQAYYLYVGATPGTKELIDTGEIQTTSVTIASLPLGRVLYARLWTLHGGVWRAVDRSFRTRPVAHFVTPATPGAELDVQNDRISWTTVPDVQAYYLYVGTQAGANDVINTGEIATTSVAISSLPLGQTFHARLWTRHGGTWRFVDSTFTTRAVAYFILPQPLPAELDVRQQRISWSAVSGVQCYYLYVGTSPGAKDLIDTGEITRTSVTAAALPLGRQLYARLYTKYDNVWRYVDRTFKTRPVAYVNNISDGQSNVDVRGRIAWTAVTDATAYYLYVGTAPGTRDLISSGEITATSYPLNALAGGVNAYVTLWTKHGGAWRSTELRFTTANSARLVSPAIDVTQIGTVEQEFRWNPVNGALGYRLLIGTTPGDASMFDSGTLTSTTVRVPALPGGAQAHVRVGTLTATGWIYYDVLLTTRSIPALIEPRLGATALAAPLNVRWTAVSSATAYRLELGDGVGNNNLLDTGLLTEVHYLVHGLGPGRVVHARISARVGGVWRYSDSVFTTGPQQPAAVLSPSAGGQLDAGYGFEWTAVPVARAYRLEIGTVPGASDVRMISNLRITRRIVAGLPTGVTLYGKLVTEGYDGSEQASAFSFVVGPQPIDAEDAWEIARWAAGAVRGMATSANEPHPTSLLASWVDQQGRPRASCTDYAAVLRLLFDQLGVQLTFRTLGVCLVPNQYDCHTLIELLHPADGVWTVLDPTFGLSVRNADDGSWATSADLSAAVRSQSWGALEYEFLTPAADAFARSYYLDYPLLFINIYRPGKTGFVEDPPDSLLQYYEFVGDSIDGVAAHYALQCPPGAVAVAAVVDGIATQLACSTPDRLTRVFGATSVRPAGGAQQPLSIYRPRRFLFQNP